MKVSVLKVKQQKEYNECLEIRKKVFREEQKWAKEDEIDEFEDEAVHFLAFVGDRPAGTARFRFKDGLIKFERVATLPAFRGQGVGSNVIKKMLDEAKDKFPSYLPAMHAQTHAVPFYKKLGWIPVGESFIELGNEVIIMVHPPKNQDKVQELKCMEDPKTPPPISEFLESVVC